IARYDSSGVLDPGFGAGGVVTTDFSGGSDITRALAIQSDGKIVVVGSTRPTGSLPYDIALARYNPDGSLDSSFGSGGKVVTTSTTSDVGYAVAIQADGEIVVAASADDTNFKIVRYNTEGSMDST